MVFSQDEQEKVLDELGDVNDAFQNFFFEALKQKAIENYDRAIEWLEKAAKESPNEGVVYYEIGKNYAYLKDWDKAEENFQKAISLNGNKPEIYAGLYDVYHSTNNYTKAIDVVLKLIPFDKDYREDLANLYERTQQYELALKVLDELDRDNGNNQERNKLRQRIYSKNSGVASTIQDLENRTSRTYTNEQDFLNLIFVYSNQGDTEKAFETAQELLSAKPDSKLAHLALYKFYLDKGHTARAIDSMQKVLSADEIDRETKLKVINDFLLFVDKNPSYESQLEQMIALFAEEENAPEVYENLGNYFLNKKNMEHALFYFEKGLEVNPRNFNLIKHCLLLQLDFKEYQKAETLSTKSLELYPSQPLLYLINGVAHLNNNNLKNAKTALETGLDFLIDDPQMEHDFYIQLSNVYEKEGNTQKMQELRNKAQKLNPK